MSFPLLEKLVKSAPGATCGQKIFAWWHANEKKLLGSCRARTGPSMCRRRWRTDAVVPRTRLEVSRFIAQKKLSARARARASTVAPWGALPLRLTAKGERVSEMFSSGFSCNRNDYMKILTNRAIFRLAASLDVMATCGPAQLSDTYEVYARYVNPRSNALS